MKKSRGQHIDTAGKDGRFHFRGKTGMFDKMQIDRFEQEKPSTGPDGEKIHGLHTGINTGSVLADPIEITIDIKVQIIYVFHRVVFLG
jgi:hypothetical protein